MTRVIRDHIKYLPKTFLQNIQKKTKDRTTTINATTKDKDIKCVT